MPEDFVFWLKEIVEDDPIPYEIKHIYFSINLKNKICCLALGGRELPCSVISDFEYFPLEAQFFYNVSLNKINDLYLAKLAVKQLIEYAFSLPNIKKIFKHKTIYIGEFMKQPEFEQYIN